MGYESCHIRSCATRSKLQTYLDISLDINLDLSRTSVGQGKDLTLIVSFLSRNERSKIAHSSGLSVCCRLLEVDSRVESVHQPNGVELGLDALEERTEER